jgi:hypothetical protein
MMWTVANTSLLQLLNYRNRTIFPGRAQHSSNSTRLWWSNAELFASLIEAVHFQRTTALSTLHLNLNTNINAGVLRKRFPTRCKYMEEY